jgi:hypothetical protein
MTILFLLIDFFMTALFLISSSVTILLLKELKEVLGLGLVEDFFDLVFINSTKALGFFFLDLE